MMRVRRRASSSSSRLGGRKPRRRSLDASGYGDGCATASLSSQSGGPCRIHRRAAQGWTAGASVEIDQRRGRTFSRHARRPDRRDYRRGARGIRRGGDGQAFAREDAPPDRRISRTASAGGDFDRKARAGVGRDSSRAGIHGRMLADARRLDAAGGESLSDMRGRIDLPGLMPRRARRCSARCSATRRGSSAPIISWRARAAARIGSLLRNRDRGECHGASRLNATLRSSLANG